MTSGRSSTRVGNRSGSVVTEDVVTSSLYPRDKFLSRQSPAGVENTQDQPSWIGRVGSATVRAASTGEVPAHDAATLARLARAENFPVALRVLPARVRRDLHAVYALARLIDDVGDD